MRKLLLAAAIALLPIAAQAMATGEPMPNVSPAGFCNGFVAGDQCLSDELTAKVNTARLWDNIALAFQPYCASTVRRSGYRAGLVCAQTYGSAQ
jgi:hypothetical protein